MPLPILSDVAPNREVGGAEWLFTFHDGVAPGHWHVVHHPLVHVALVNTISEKFHLFPVCFFLPAVVLGAEDLWCCDIPHETYLWQGWGGWRRVQSNKQQSSHCMRMLSVSLRTPPAVGELVYGVGAYRGRGEGKPLTCPRFSTGSLSGESSSTSQKSKLTKAEGEGGGVMHVEEVKPPPVQYPYLEYS